MAVKYTLGVVIYEYSKVCVHAHQCAVPGFSRLQVVLANLSG